MTWLAKSSYNRKVDLAKKVPPAGGRKVLGEKKNGSEIYKWTGRNHGARPLLGAS